MVHFPVSGVTTYVWLPPLVAFVISYFTSMAGVSGAFLLLPFQMSVLGFTSPAVSSTNLVFNLAAIPGGVYRYVREGRLLVPLAIRLLAGTVPGMILGGIIRLRLLPDPLRFKVFAGCVLLAIGARLAMDLHRNRRRAGQRLFHASRNPGPRQDVSAANSRRLPGAPEAWQIEVLSGHRQELVFRFQDREYHCATWSIWLLSLVVGLIGGIYGIGGGAIIAPILVAVYDLPVHVVAGAALLGTFATSLVGVGFYQLAAGFHPAGAEAVAPDWWLGLLFGLGGMAGMYLGARSQRFVPATWIKGLLVIVLLAVSLGYLAEFFAVGIRG
jgi:uncharacterized membrane protein YfcA